LLLHVCWECAEGEQRSCRGSVLQSTVLQDLLLLHAVEQCLLLQEKCADICAWLLHAVHGQGQARRQRRERLHEGTWELVHHAQTLRLLLLLLQLRLLLLLLHLRLLLLHLC
jgi:hypothetical protein